MSQENGRLSQVNWRLIAVEALLVGALLLLASGVLAATGGWDAWFERGVPASGEFIQPAAGGESLEAVPVLDSGAAPGAVKPAGGSGCEHERVSPPPEYLD